METLGSYALTRETLHLAAGESRRQCRRKATGLATSFRGRVGTTTAERKFARFLASGFDVIVDGLPRLLRQFKPDRPADPLLADCRAIDRIPARRNVLDPKCDDIAASQLAVDRQIKHYQISLDLTIPPAVSEPSSRSLLLIATLGLIGVLQMPRRTAN
jgi:hypothetical protein